MSIVLVIIYIVNNYEISKIIKTSYIVDSTIVIEFQSCLDFGDGFHFFIDFIDYVQRPSMFRDRTFL